MKISNKKIHFFNPGHENAIRTGQPHYTPPASVSKMMTDLALLPVWYGEEGDYVIMNETNEAFRFLLSLPADIRPEAIPILPSGLAQLNLSTTFEAAPWGLSPHSIRFFEKLRDQAQDEQFVIPQWKEIYTRLTGRQTALGCLSKIRSLLPEAFESLTLPRFCSTPDEIRRFMAEYPPPYLLKTPYSCSGRGLYRIQEGSFDLQASRWTEGAFKKQGVVSIERALDKALDFAMEFESDGEGNIRFEGLAVFETLPKGAFYGNVLGSQETLERQITEFIPAAHLREIQAAVVSVLTEVAGFVYRGYLGVDMLVYRKGNSFAVHPFIELNVRNTMGIVALQLSNRLVHPSSRGQIIITCDTVKNKAYQAHRQMEEKYPLQLAGSKIRSGYLSLCPVTPETHYRAYILINEVRGTG